MVLVLRIETLQPDVPLPLPHGGWVEADHDLSIGRAAENDVVLEDPAGTISKRHCTIKRLDTAYALVDHSRNGSFLNGDTRPVARDVPLPLKPGDAIQIGSFNIAVIAAMVTTANSGAGDLRAEAEKGEEAPRAETSFLGAVPSMRSSRAHVDPGGLMSRQGPPLAEGDMDAVTSPQFGDDSLLEHRIGKGEPPPAFSDHVPVPNMVFVQPRLSTESIPDDWDLLSEMGHAPAPLSPQPAAPILAEKPAPAPQPAPPPPVDATPAGEPRGAVVHEAAILAFLEGSGLRPDECRPVDMTTVMRRAGRALQLSVANLHDLLGVRKTTKEGFGVERTMLARSGNNPLKFVADPHDALIALLVATIPGFLVADEAIAQAFTDIKEHQIAMVSAMQAALASICQQLAPETIERVTGAPTMLERLMPRRRLARQWQAYREAFDKVAAGIDTNAREVFGSDFVRAYRQDRAPADARATAAPSDEAQGDEAQTDEAGAKAGSERPIRHGPLPNERRDFDVG
jgi:type VI secretion system FHA domain protein